MPDQEENMFVPARVMKRIITATTLAIAAWTTPVIAKECYAPDARAQERADDHEGNFTSSCAAMKCGLASRKILTNAAPVLPIRIDRHSLNSAASTLPLRCADCFAVVEAQD